MADGEKKGGKNIAAHLNTILIVALVIGAGIVWYIVFATGNPRQDYGTPEETIMGYSEFVVPMATGAGFRPDRGMIAQFLEFFDSDSRAYFRENHRYMARVRTQFDDERFEGLGRTDLEAEAVLYLVRKPPLGGIGRIVNEEQIEDGRVRLNAVTLRNVPRTFTMRRSGGLWYFEDFAGALDEIEEDLRPARARMP